MPLHFKQDPIYPVRSVKILGIITDQLLRFKEHIANKAKKAARFKTIKHAPTILHDSGSNDGLRVPYLVSSSV